MTLFRVKKKQQQKQGQQRTKWSYCFDKPKLLNIHKHFNSEHYVCDPRQYLLVQISFIFLNPSLHRHWFGPMQRPFSQSPHVTGKISNQNQIKSSLYSPHYAEACNELRGPSPRLSAWATQLRRNVATVASRWRHCADLTGPGIEPQTSRTESVRFATELTAGLLEKYKIVKSGNQN